MKPSIFKIHNIDNGTLYIMPKPSGDWLIEDASYYKNIGINTIVSLLEFSEAYSLGLSNEGEIFNDLGINFINFEIQDRSTPNIHLANKIVNCIKEKLNAGQNLSIHCRAGIGRSGLIASCVLMSYGFSANNAIALVSSARGITIPDTLEQHEFIYQFNYL